MEAAKRPRRASVLSSLSFYFPPVPLIGKLAKTEVGRRIFPPPSFPPTFFSPCAAPSTQWRLIRSFATMRSTFVPSSFSFFFSWCSSPSFSSFINRPLTRHADKGEGTFAGISIFPPPSFFFALSPPFFFSSFFFLPPFLSRAARAPA